MLLRCVLAIVLISFHPFIGAETNAEAEDRIAKEFSELDWHEAGTFKLEASHSTISVPEGYFVVIGNDAMKERRLAGDVDPSSVEAVIYNQSFSECVIFENVDEGYVKLDDWNEIDSKQLLISNNIEFSYSTIVSKTYYLKST